MNEYDEYAGGTILNQCPHCGQFCKIPEYYHATFKPCLEHSGHIGEIFTGCYAKSYCKRCKKEVLLEVEFI